MGIMLTFLILLKMKWNQQQNDLLNQQAEKMLRKYQRYQGYERQMKIKQALYRKGFYLDDIDDWVTEHLN